MNKLNFLIIILFAFVTLNCGNKKQITIEKSDDSKQETKKEGTDASQDSKNDKKNKDESIQQSKEDINKANELGMTPGLPNNFPSDVPQPKNSKTLGSLNSSEGTVVTFESNDKVLDIVNFYKEEMKKNGYVLSEGGESMISDKGGLVDWKKDTKEVGLMLGYDKDKNITSLVITYK